MIESEIRKDISYSELKSFYTEYFGLGYLPGDINLKFALISLTGYIVKAMKRKNPDITYYKVLYKIAEGTGISELEIKCLSIICEDFALGCTSFPTFGIKPRDMPAKIKEIMCKALPF